MIPGLLRGFAVLIALVAILDPAVSWTRRTPAQIAVVTVDRSTDREVTGEVVDQLDAAFTVIDGNLTSAAATVLVGDRLPRDASALPAPVFAVRPERRVVLTAIRAAARSSLQARVPVTVSVNVEGARGRSLHVTLQAGPLTVDRATRGITADNVQIDVPLSFVPTAPGAIVLRATAAIDGAAPAAMADLVIDVHEDRWAVLFFDARPSWMSTFVRRAIERDPRFNVTSRTVTSRSVSTDAGRPPSLADTESLARFDGIVAGAPDALDAQEIAGLEAFMRRYGGSTVLLIDRRASGPFDRLTGSTAWLTASADTGVMVRRIERNSGGLRASEIIWPTPLPVGARLIANSGSATDGVGAMRPVVWQTAFGAGRLLVSGALDAWRFRDATTSSFDLFWQTTLAEAAAATPAPIDVRVLSPVLRPGETTDVIVTLREPFLADGPSIRATAGATLESSDGQTMIRLWPDGSAGRFRGVIRTPSEAGSYRVAVSSGEARAIAPVEVASDARVAARPMPDLIAAWASAHGGAMLPASGLAELPGVLMQALSPEQRRVLWYPMRSAWWILPFALALAAEWWWRRRRGLA